MANGFMPYLLEQSKAAFNTASAQEKITPYGFLDYLLSNAQPNILSNGVDDGSGHTRDVRLKYQKRVPAGRSVTTDDCEINAIPSYSEANVTLSYFRKLSMFIPDNTIAQYNKEASQIINAGAPPSAIMREIWESIIRQAGGLLADVNGDLCAKLASGIGVNAATGAATAQTINFLLDGNSNNLAQGMTKIMRDAQVNEMSIQNASIVGDGLISNYYMQQQAKGVDGAGLNTSSLAMPKFYWDPKFQGAFGVNRFVMLEKNAVQLIKRCKYRGAFGGDKGISQFGTITLPIVDSMGNGTLRMWEFDYQLKYNDCPQETDVSIYGYGGSTYTTDRGWILTLSNYYDIFLQPSTAYETDDRLYQNNGTLLFLAANS